MPQVQAHYLIDYLFEVGPTEGQEPVSFTELMKWQEAIGIELEPWQFRMLRRLSLDYLSESHKAMKHDCPPPWAPENKPAVSETQSALRRLASL